MGKRVLACGHTQKQHDEGLGRRDMCKGFSDIELEEKATFQVIEEEEEEA